MEGSTGTVQAEAVLWKAGVSGGTLSCVRFLDLE